MNRYQHLFLLLFSTACLSGCGSGLHRGPALTITPQTATLMVGSSELLRLTQENLGTATDVTTVANWSADSSLAHVTKGYVTCDVEGQVTINASYGGEAGTASLDCQTPQILKALRIEGAATPLRSNALHQVTVTALYSDGSNRNVTRLASYTTDERVASATGTGAITCNDSGTGTLTATLQNVSATSSLTCITQQPPSLKGPLERSRTFDGPFRSWIPVTRFGAVGDGVHDDTAAIQAGLDYTKSAPGVLYFPKGTYRITHSLLVKGSQGVSILGEDPLTTTIRWNAAQADDMLVLNGCELTNIGRLSFAGLGHAASAIHLTWDQSSGSLYPTRNLLHDLILSGAARGVVNDFAGETTVDRVHFDQLSQAGFQTADWNAANVNIRDSLFTDCALGVTNLGGMGLFNVANSVFERSVQADMAIWNTGSFSIRNNISVDSNIFFLQTAAMSPASVVIQGNLVIHPKLAPIYFEGNGPLSLVDNTFTEMPSSQPIVYETHDQNIAGVIFFAAGNQYVSLDPYVGEYLPKNVYDEAPLEAFEQARPVLPTEIYVPPSSQRAVYEVDHNASTNEIQAAVDDAAAHHGTVHFVTGVTRVGGAIVIPDGADLHIDGDGEPTVLTTTGAAPVLLIGNGRTELNDLTIGDPTVSKAIAVRIDDTPSTELLCEECTSLQAKVGIRWNGLDDALFEADDSLFSGTTALDVAGGTRRQNHLASLGAVGAFGTSSNLFEVTQNGSLVLEGGFHDGGQGPDQALLVGESRVSIQGGESFSSASSGSIHLQNHSGVFTLLGQTFTSTVLIDGQSSGLSLLAGSVLNRAELGEPVLEEGSTELVANQSVAYANNGPPYVVSTTSGDWPQLAKSLALARTRYSFFRDKPVPQATSVRLERVVLISNDTNLDVNPTHSYSSQTYSFFKESCTNSPLHDVTLEEAADGSDYVRTSNGYLALDLSTGLPTFTPTVPGGFGRWFVQRNSGSTFAVVNQATGSSLDLASCSSLTVSSKVVPDWVVIRN